jgi:hypothetical protein
MGEPLRGDYFPKEKAIPKKSDSSKKEFQNKKATPKEKSGRRLPRSRRNFLWNGL